MVASEDEVCPVCAARNESGKLTLFQVNLGQAIKLCSRKQCPYPLGVNEGNIPVVNRNASDIVIKKRKSSAKTSSRSSTCSTSSSSRCSTPVDGLNNWSPALTSPALQQPSFVQPFAKSDYIPSPPPPTRVVTLDDPSVNKNIPKNNEKSTPKKNPRLQWKNKDALCWLDVVMCVLVHSKQLRKLFKSTSDNEQSILRTLIAAYDQAQALLELATCSEESLPDKTANLETSVGTITVKTGGGELSPLSCLPGVNYAEDASNPLVQQDDDDFFKCLDDLDFDAETTNFDIQSLENLLEGKLDSPVKNQKSPVRTMVQNAAARAVKSEIKNRDVCLAEANLRLEDVREQVWQSISTKLRCRKGKDDSPVFALPLLLQKSQSVSELFNLPFTWYLTCNRCGHEHKNPIQKTLTTFPNTPTHFSMTAPCFIRDCFNCKTNNQQMNMLYHRLPKVLMIHFVEGLPSNMTWSRLDFMHSQRTYKVTGVVQFKTRPDHFVAWLRDPMCKYLSKLRGYVSL